MPDPTVVRLEGDLTVDSVDGERRRLMPIAGRPGVRLVLDLEGVPIATTPGIGLLLELHHRVREGRGRLVLARPTRHVGGVIQRTQLERVLLVADDLETAVRLASAE